MTRKECALKDKPPLPPGPRGHWLLGALPDFRRRPLELLLELPEQYGDVAHIRLGPVNAVVIRHPDDVRRVLQRNHQNYSKRTRGVKKLRRLLGDGLLTSDGDSWLRQRRISQPAFHRKRIQHFADTMVDHTREAIKDWEKATGPMDMGEEMMLLTLRIAAQTLFSSDVQGEAGKLSDALTQGFEFFTESFSRPWDPPEWLPTPSNIRMNRNKALIDRIVDGLVSERRGREEEHEDLLSMLMLARDEETGERLTGTNLRDALLTILIAGHETTANALVMILDLLARHPDAYDRVRQEALAAWADGPPTLEDLQRLPWTTACIHEGLRLNPPAVVKMLLDRHAASDPAVLRSVLDGPLGLLRGGSRRQQAVV